MKGHTNISDSSALQIGSESAEKNIFGFWVYIMTDCMVFASLFATFAVLRNNTFGGPGGKELFNLPFVLSETLILLTSSFVCGLAILAARQKNKNAVLGLLFVTFLLGVSFLSLEVTEFRHLVEEGNSWRVSGFLSAFFTLVGTHGLHIFIGLFWMAVMIFQVAKNGLLNGYIRKLVLLSIFWHFLDVVWIFIFTIVYLMGAI